MLNEFLNVRQIVIGMLFIVFFFFFLLFFVIFFQLDYTILQRFSIDFKSFELTQL